MIDLSTKLRDRVEFIADTTINEAARSKTEKVLADLVGWTAEVAADSDITEQRWNTIYEASEELRLAIQEDPSGWDADRQDKAMQLSALTREAWDSLEPRQQRKRFIEHAHHDHGHGDGHGHDHGHDHDHGHGHSHDHGHDHDSIEVSDLPYLGTLDVSDADEHPHGHGDEDHSHDHDHHQHDDQPLDLSTAPISVSDVTETNE